MSKMQKPKSRLGRGLSSLISVSEPDVEAETSSGDVKVEEAPVGTPPVTWATPNHVPAAASTASASSADKPAAVSTGPVAPPLPPLASTPPALAPTAPARLTPAASVAPKHTVATAASVNTMPAPDAPTALAPTAPPGAQQPNRPLPGRDADGPARPTAATPAASSALSSTAPVPRGTEQSPAGSPLEIPLADVAPNPHQPRRQFDDAAMSELAASLKSNGVIQPIVVRRVENRFELVAGERRLRAAKLAGLTTIPAIIRDVDSFNQAQMALVENIHRADLNPMERAAAYRALIGQLGLTQAELANRLGEDRSTVANFLRLLDLAEPVRAMIRDDRLSLGHAKVLAGVSDILEQERLGNLVVSQGLSVRNLERLVQSATTATPARPAKSSSAHFQDLEKSFARQLGMRVQIRAGANKSKGRVVIHYASLDQFDQLSEKLGVESDR